MEMHEADLDGGVGGGGSDRGETEFSNGNGFNGRYRDDRGGARNRNGNDNGNGEFHQGPEFHFVRGRALSPESSAAGADSERRRRPRLRPRVASISPRRFDVRTLPPDMKRVYDKLERESGEEYALLFVFQMRTAVELHRAWHMTLLTVNILQKVKDAFGLRMSWNLGVVKLIFRVEDGGYELHRKVPYDYDSEYQDLYYRIALALVEGHISVHEALVYQTEAKRGMHTATSGKFLRSPPGRLILYPAQAATCAIIFFHGKWIDMAVAAICGLAAGLLDWALARSDNRSYKMLIDLSVGFSTGLIGGAWYDYATRCCLPAVFLGTLYWFFYGTAFVIGLLEIIAGELETGVTRFVAVSIKTFVLSLGAALGLMLVSWGGAADIWSTSQRLYCDASFVREKWWRIPMYLACSVAVLGQYRLPLDKYWMGLIVQFVAYEVQYQVFWNIDELQTSDNLDTASSNIMGAAGGVIAACALSWLFTVCQGIYSKHLLQSDDRSHSRLDSAIYKVTRCFVKINRCLRFGRKSDVLKFDMKRKLREQNKQLKNPSHPREQISLTQEEENLFLETIVAAREINPWSILMPALYQLVPGSVIARYWFHAIFPPDELSKSNSESAFANLMVISTSLALGTIFGFAIVQFFLFSLSWLPKCCFSEHHQEARKTRQGMTAAMYTTIAAEDPQSTRLSESGVNDTDSSFLRRTRATEMESGVHVK